MMIYTPITKLALNTAYKAHEGQLDRSGLPYIFHPYHVAEQMKDETTCAIALLHDVVEDTDMTLEELEKLFPPAVTETGSSTREFHALQPGHCPSHFAVS